ncbi:MAG TPA: EVE domain-containing protein [Patescibacteria group bacterium]
MQYWLIKSEPSVYSIDDLERDKTTYWDGIRNYQARNFLRDSMKVGDKIIFYHSNTEPPAAVGVAEVSKEGYPDFTAWDKEDPHFDPKSDPSNPTWYMVDIAFVKKFTHPLSLDAMKANPDLAGLMVIQKGARLSVQPVSKEHFERLVQLGS